MILDTNAVFAGDESPGSQAAAESPQGPKRPSTTQTLVSVSM
jgi:hypothetical protein